jgi:sulfur carrier protein
MQITINGEQKEYPDGSTLGLIIDDLDIKIKIMAVAVNMQVVKKSDWSRHLIVENDKIELLHFVGGG